MPVDRSTTVVLEALARSRGKGAKGQGYRTVRGLAGETRLSEAEVRTVLARHPELFVRSSIPDASGAALFGLSASAPRAGPRRPSSADLAVTKVQPTPYSRQSAETTDAARGLDPSAAAPEHMSADALNLFYSYSHRDEQHRQRLETHLSPLRRDGLIKEWHDRRIEAGTDWRRDIDRELNRADLILLLVSPDFMASDFAYLQELSAAMERHRAGTARVVPIIVKPVDWHSAQFGDLQALPRDGKPVTTWPNRDNAWYNVAQGLRATIGDLQSGRRMRRRSA
jgi:hypothetical protein